MPRILPTWTTPGAHVPHETASPPNPERPTAASIPTSQRTRRRTVRLAAAVVAVAALATACEFGPGPSPSSAPAPSPAASAALSPDEAVIREVFGPLGVADQAVSVAACESGLNPMAGYPDATYKGLFQLGPHIVAIYQYGGDFFDARANVQAARDLYVSRGNWSAWPVCGR